MMSFVPWSPAAAVDDASLARRVAGGDRDALALAYAREAGPVYRYALALCGNAAWAADATQALMKVPPDYAASRPAPALRAPEAAASKG